MGAAPAPIGDREVALLMGGHLDTALLVDLAPARVAIGVTEIGAAVDALSILSAHAATPPKD